MKNKKAIKLSEIIDKFDRLDKRDKDQINEEYKYNSKYEMPSTRSSYMYEPTDREKDVKGIFGVHGKDVPPAVLRYLRKNPAALIERLYNMYGDDMDRWVSQAKSKVNKPTPTGDEDVLS